MYFGSCIAIAWRAGFVRTQDLGRANPNCFAQSQGGCEVGTEPRNPDPQRRGVTLSVSVHEGVSHQQEEEIKAGESRAQPRLC